MSPRVIAVANASGSAGKTTGVVSLAALLADQGKTVLVIDGDAQATATRWLGVDPGEAPGIGDLLMRRATYSEVVVATRTEGLHLIPSSRALDLDVIALTATTGGEQRLRIALAKNATADVVLIDCPGTINQITLAALVASDAVVTVTQPTMKEMTGIPELEDTIAQLAEAYNPDLYLAGVIPSIVPAGNGKLYQDALKVLADNYDDLVTPPVRRTIRVPEAHGQRVPLPRYAPTADVTDDYRRVLAWLTAKGVL